MSESRYNPDAPIFHKLTPKDFNVHDQGKIWDEYERMFIEASGQASPIERQLRVLKNRKERGSAGGYQR